MNVVVKKGYENRDPFSQSDRDPIGRGAGKGDRDRSERKKFRDGYDQIDWGRLKKEKK